MLGSTFSGCSWLWPIVAELARVAELAKVVERGMPMVERGMQLMVELAKWFWQR